MLQKLLRIGRTAVGWALAWGLTGAAAGLSVIILQLDTGHFPANKVPVLIGVTCAVYGLCAGFIYGALAVAFGFDARLWSKRLIALGAELSCAAGAVFIILFGHSYIIFVVAIVIVVLLAIVSFRRKGSSGV
jgi:hypothetical protein